MRECVELRASGVMNGWGDYRPEQERREGLVGVRGAYLQGLP